MAEKSPIAPPIPPSHPGYRHWLWESAKIPFLFYLDVLSVQLLLLLALSLVERLFRTQVQLPLIAALWLIATGACVVRMVNRLLRARRQRGEAPNAAVAAFALVLVIPIVALGGWAWKTRQAVESIPLERQREGRLALQAIFEAENAFARDFGGRYTLNLRELNLHPELRYYVVGFASACGVKAGVPEDKIRTEPAIGTWVERREREVGNFFRRVRRPEDCADPREGFEAFAVGVIFEGGALDVWSIDEAQRVRHWPEAP